MDLKNRIVIIFYTVLLLLLSSQLQSDSGTWNIGNGDWASNASWTSTPNPFPAAGDTATFDNRLGDTIVTVNLPNGPVETLSITGGSFLYFSFAGNTLTPTNINISGDAEATFGLTQNVLLGGILTTSGTSETTLSGDQTLTSAALNGNSATSLIGTLTCPGGVTINDTASLAGAGTIEGSVTNNATLLARDEFASTSLPTTINITGNYIQSAQGTYNLAIQGDAVTSLLDITGTANLAGTVDLNPLAGIYTEGTTYTILSANGGVTGAFTSLVESHDLSFSLTTNANNVILTILGGAIITPTSSLSPNAQNVNNYLLGNANVQGPARELVQTLLQVPAGLFNDALLQLSPIQYGAFTLVSFQNNIHVADILSRRNNYSFCDCYKNKGSLKRPGQRPINYNLENYRQMWVEPIGYYYHQKPYKRQRGFDNYTYGVSYGMEFPVPDLLTLFGALGYTHSNIVWYPVFGDARTNSVYLGFGPSVAVKDAFASLLVQGNVDFINSTRKIHFPGINASTSSSHNSYNLLCRLHAGYRPYLNPYQTMFFQTEVQLNYINFFEEAYREIGAGNANLEVNHKHSVYLQPNAKVKLIKEFYSQNFCFTPNIFMGWLANIPIISGRYRAHMYNIITGSSNFTVTTYHDYINQLTFGGEFSMNQCKNFLFTVGYEGSVFDQLNVQAVRIRFEWAF